jgi:uncharacterized oligopeptide transporter (OPT) family protein
VAAAGLITLLKTLPTIVAALTAGAADLRKGGGGAPTDERRTNRDLSTTVVLGGSLLIVALMWSLLTFKPVPGAYTGLTANLLAAVLVVIFGFLFVTVSSRIVGLIGTSSNPISGMAIATLMATCGVFLAVGWTSAAYGALALMIGGTVCIAAANAGNTSQDLKTGYIVGATPSAQQKGLFLGVIASSFVIGLTLIAVNAGLEKFVPADIAVDLAHLPEGAVVENTAFVHEGRSYTLLNVIGSPTIAEGKYLVNPDTGRIEVQWIQGIGSAEAPAPQARLMSVVINGILNRKLPWGLVLLGVFLVIAVELLGVRSLSFAVGSYIGIGTTAAIFCGGLVRWLVERGHEEAKGDDETGPGALFASGLIAAGGIVGLLGIVVKLAEKQDWLPKDAIDIGQYLPAIHQSDILGILVFAALAFSLYHFARKPLQ